MRLRRGRQRREGRDERRPIRACRTCCLRRAPFSMRTRARWEAKVSSSRVGSPALQQGIKRWNGQPTSLRSSKTKLSRRPCCNVQSFPMMLLFYGRIYTKVRGRTGVRLWQITGYGFDLFRRSSMQATVIALRSGTVQSCVICVVSNCLHVLFFWSVVRRAASSTRARA